MSPRSPARCELQPRSSQATRTPQRRSADDAASQAQCYMLPPMNGTMQPHELQPRSPALRHAHRRQRMQTPRELQPRSPRTSGAMQMSLPCPAATADKPKHAAQRAANAQPPARCERPGSAKRMPPPPLFSHPPCRSQYECHRPMQSQRDADAPLLPPDYKNTPGRRDAAPSPMRMLLRNPRTIRAPTRAPNKFYAGLLIVLRLPAMVSAYENTVASGPLEEALAATG
ncbi:hypothetical protein B0H13DRAFT_2131443 [Mycena leptocephala]|nr:hypothetical protein B0H13DRAFT_2131443 [Mycena leptocephala]